MTGSAGNHSLVPILQPTTPVAVSPVFAPATGSPAPTLADRWRALRRKRRPASWAGLSVLGLFTLIAMFWPATYRSTGTILIEQQELPVEMVQSTITSYADQRIQVISQRVMTTDNLLRIIDRYDLYPRVRQHEPREILLDQMRHDIKFQMISADVMDPRQGRAVKADIAFSVSYDSRSPDLSARVANELVSLYLDENVKTRRQQTADAASFLQEQAEALSKQIDAQLAKISAFKDQHINALPDQAVINYQELTRDQDELRDIDTQLRSLGEQSTLLQGQLSQLSPSSQVYTSTGERVLSPTDRLKFLRTEYARVSGIYGPTHPDVLRIKREIDGLEKSSGSVDAANDLQRQLQDAKAKLADAQERYSPDHPDVIRYKRQIDALSKQIQDISQQQPTVSSSVSTPDNPVYIQAKSQRDAVSSERAALLQKRSEVSAHLTQVESHIASSPAVERDYSAMMRELDNEQLRYREVQQKQMEAKLAQNLEDQQKGERFTLIDPPLVPEQPASPNRILLLAVGLLLAFAAALGTAVMLDNADPSIRNRHDLEMMLQVPPLAVLPFIETDHDRATSRRHRNLVIASSVTVVVIALLAVHFLYRPLDVIWEVAWRKLGG